MNQFKKEQKKIKKDIWSLIPDQGVILDVGVGKDATSAKTLAGKGAYVIAADNNFKALQKNAKINAALVCCNAAAMPFKPLTADVTLFYYTLHEINFHVHAHILSQINSISSAVVIVEPGPGTSPGQKYYQKLWQTAMEAIGKFEHYHPLEYWEKLVKSAGFTEVISKKFCHSHYMPIEVKKNLVNTTIEWFKEEGVSNTYIEKAQNLLDGLPQEMTLPDTLIVIGKLDKKK